MTNCIITFNLIRNTNKTDLNEQLRNARDVDHKNLQAMK